MIEWLCYVSIWTCFHLPDEPFYYAARTAVATLALHVANWYRAFSRRRLDAVVLSVAENLEDALVGTPYRAIDHHHGRLQRRAATGSTRRAQSTE